MKEATMRLNPQSLATASSRHAWRTIAIWVVVLVAGFAASGVLLSDALTTDLDFTNNPEAKQAQQILEQRKLEQDIVPETIVMTGGEAARAGSDLPGTRQRRARRVARARPEGRVSGPGELPAATGGGEEPGGRRARAD